MPAYNFETALFQQLAEANSRIAELEQALVQANEVQSLCRIMVNTIPTQLFWKDLHQNYLGANQKFAQAAGLSSPEQLIGKSDYHLKWKDLAEIYRARTPSAKAPGSTAKAGKPD